MKKHRIFSICSVFLIFALHIFPAHGVCVSPGDFVSKVYSVDGQNVAYELLWKDDWASMSVIFFGKRGVTMRHNTIMPLTSFKGSFQLPEKALQPPPQRWFNFVVQGKDGCKMWGLVNQAAIEGKNNRIVLDNPSGEGHAFLLK